MRREMKKRIGRLLVTAAMGIAIVIMGAKEYMGEDIQATATANTISEGRLRQTVMSLVTSAENSSLEYSRQYGYIEDIGDGRGYTGGIIGFTTGTADLLEVVELYVKLKPDNNCLKKYIPALQSAIGSDTHKGLGQYIYYDAMVVHGPGEDGLSFGGIRKAAMKKKKTPAQGGGEAEYLKAFLTARTSVMLTEEAHLDLSRLQAQSKFIDEGKYNLELPLKWNMYGDDFELTEAKLKAIAKE